MMAVDLIPGLYCQEERRREESMIGYDSILGYYQLLSPDSGLMLRIEGHCAALVFAR